MDPGFEPRLSGSRIYDLTQWFMTKGPCSSTDSITWELIRIPSSLALPHMACRGSAGFYSTPGGSDACSGLRTSALIAFIPDSLTGPPDGTPRVPVPHQALYPALSIFMTGEQTQALRGRTLEHRTPASTCLCVALQNDWAWPDDLFRGTEGGEVGHTN